MEYDITVYQGATFTLVLTITDDATPTPNPIDITGYTFRGQIRSTTSSDTVQADFSYSLTDPTNGEVTLTITAAETAGISLPENCNPTHRTTRMVYDVESESPGGDVRRWLYGTANIIPEVTR